MNVYMKNKGFTLVELLVVIAIIGILSSVVFASLNSARAKAKVAALQQQARALQPAFVLCRDGGGTVNFPTTPGATDVCTPAVGTIYPTAPSGGWTYGATVSNGGADTVKYTLECSSANCGTAKTCTISLSGVTGC